MSLPRPSRGRVHAQYTGETRLLFAKLRFDICDCSGSGVDVLEVQHFLRRHRELDGQRDQCVVFVVMFGGGAILFVAPLYPNKPHHTVRLPFPYVECYIMYNLRFRV